MISIYKTSEKENNDYSEFILICYLKNNVYYLFYLL